MSLHSINTYDLLESRVDLKYIIFFAIMMSILFTLLGILYFAYKVFKILDS